MPVRPILLVPDDRLRMVSSPVKRFDDALGALVADMFETMYAAAGRGLAAPQVGMLVRLFVTDVTWKDGNKTPRVFVNPEVIETSDTHATLEEGCLSIPEVLTPVSRPDRVRLRWSDLSGSSRESSFTGFDAVCIQHECDHLDGILCTDRAV